MRATLADLGLASYRTYCGVTLTRGAQRNAPMCPACMKKAGWKDDKRKH
ncbi:hypothetical protein [Longimycelium tulufanense]|nr:hypothetical protein [Longimycelium tulufanense]